MSKLKRWLLAGSQPRRWRCWGRSRRHRQRRRLLERWPGSAHRSGERCHHPRREPPVRTVGVVVDLAGSGGVEVFVAADPARDPLFSVRLLEVGYACRRVGNETPQQRLDRGGKKVIVGVYYNGNMIGRIVYAHVNNNWAIRTYPHTRWNHVPINRWGGGVGTVGSYTPNGCWNPDRRPDGRHVHFEVLSAPTCYWSGLRNHGTYRDGHNGYLGYVGYGNGGVCPEGI